MASKIGIGKSAKCILAKAGLRIGHLTKMWPLSWLALTQIILQRNGIEEEYND